MPKPRLRVGGRLVESAAGRLLLVYTGIAFGIAIVSSLVGGVLGVHFEIPVLMLVALVGAVVFWLVTVVEDWAPPLSWPTLDQPTASLHVGSDARTRRLDSLISSADRTHQMGNRTLRDTLRRITEDRLLRAGADEPLADAALSRGLRRYLESPDDHVPVLSRRTLHAYLKEIEQL